MHRVRHRYEALAIATVTVALCSARRMYLALLTLAANHKPSLMLPTISRLVGSHNTSPSRFVASQVQRHSEPTARSGPFGQRGSGLLVEDAEVS